MPSLPQPRGEHTADAGASAAHTLPASAWARIGLLLVALVSVKAVLLLSFSKHLYEMHWRVRDEPESWLNYAAFAGFVILGGFGLLSLATHCRHKGLRTVRAANAAVLCLGILFIFFTFHTGDKNYLYPIITGILKWGSLVPYLSLDLFFRPPFLAAWFLTYGFVYYVMARTGREIWTLHLTGLVAIVYASLCLREFYFFPEELLVLDSIGIACLIGSPDARAIRTRLFSRTASSARAGFNGQKSSSLVQFVSQTEETSHGPERAFAGLIEEPPRVKRSGLELFWAMGPFLWVIVYCLLLARVAPEILKLDRYFQLLLGGTILLFVGLAFGATRFDFFKPWTRFAPFFLSAFLLLSNCYYPMARNYNNTLCLGFEFPHYFMGELILAAALATCAWCYHRIRPKTSFRWLDVLNLSLITFAVVDLRLSQIMGVRLEYNVLRLGDSPKMMWRMAKPYVPALLFGLVAAVLLYALALHVIQCWLRARSRKSASPDNPSLLTRADIGVTSLSPGLYFAIASFLCLTLLGWSTVDPDKATGESVLRLAGSSPFWSRALTRPLNPQQFLKTANQLGLAPFAAANEQPISGEPADLNVLIVFMESSYNKYLSLFGSEYETQPLLSKYKDRMEVFPNFFSDFASSIHARFATFTSLYPVLDYNAFTLHPVKVKSIFEVLHEHAYSCSMFYSSSFDFTDFGDFLKGRGFDEMYDANNMPTASGTETVNWGLKEETTLAAIRQRIQRYASDKQRFFLTYVPAAPHYPYDSIPDRFRKFKKGAMNDFTPVYLNELLYMDWVIASIIDQLRDSDLLDHTLVVITNDHGEMLGGEGGTIGHGWAFTPELANTPLIIMDPRNSGWHVNYTIGSQVDFLPSLLDLLNLPLPPGELYEGRSMYRPDTHANRRIYLNTCQQFGILQGNRIIVGDRNSQSKAITRTKATSFTISNQGTKTLFTETTASAPPVSIREFDEFQENLLHNYSVYCQTLCKNANPLARQSRQSAAALLGASRQ